MYKRQREVAERITRQGLRVIRPVAIVTILAGILRGTVYERIQSLDVLLQTRYGIVWLIALIAAIATYAWSETMLIPNASERTFGLPRVTAARRRHSCARPIA